MIRVALLVAVLAAPALAEPGRVVSAGGDLTEIVFALGAGDALVGVDATSSHPPEAAGKAQIGYVRALSAEGLLSLAPDLVIAAHDAGPEAALEQVQAAGVTVARAPEGAGPEGVAAKIRFVGEALGREAEAEALVAEVEAAMAAALAAVARAESRPGVLFVLALRDGAPLVGGRDTAADAIIGLAGGHNVAEGFDGYKPMSPEAILAAAPEIILMMDGSSGEHGLAGLLETRPEFRLTPAGRDGRLVTMPGLLLLGFGPRTPEAVLTLARALHPETVR